MSRLAEAAQGGNLVIFAGAGVSAGAPTSLPGWKPLNAAIFRALRKRLETGVEAKDWLLPMEAFLDSQRDADKFPPDYQAQVIEEMCGVRYFQALQALDVDVTNAAHRGIAALTASGAVRAIVTTNFDRLIERALDAQCIAYEAAYDTERYLKLRDRLVSGEKGPVPVIKIHGSVSDPLSMIDTLKQRRKGRSRAIEECLEQLGSGYWLYLGFSAADLETDPKYLGLVSGASRSSGATYVTRPGGKELGAGAKLLMKAYGDRGVVAAAEVGDFTAQIGLGVHAPAPPEVATPTLTGGEEFEVKLAAWASGLTMAATGLCLAAILEATGQSEPAVRILDKLARKEIFEERGTPDFQALQLQYGRLGAAFGRFINVPDMNGVASNASVETEQSLLRLQGTEYAARAMGWMPCLYLWLNRGADAMGLAAQIMEGFYKNEWGPLTPATDEAAVDSWLAAAQVCIVNTHVRTLRAVVGTAPDALDRAKRSGDVVRTARVLGLYLLALGETKEDVPAIARQHTAEINDARRVGDGVGIGFLALALGRWHTGPGGLDLAKQKNDYPGIAQTALQYLSTADLQFQNQVMDPWRIFVAVQQAKALTDLHEFDDVGSLFQHVKPGLERFPVFLSHMHEAVGQYQFIRRDPDAAESFRRAIGAAEQSGLHLRAETLREHYGAQAGTE
jgi:SIR2-like domain